MKSIRTSIELDAPPDAVWRVIEDFTSYGEWNPFVVGIAGEGRIGAPIDVQISVGGKARRFRSQIVEWMPGRSLRWRGTVVAGWLLRGEHGLAVEPLPDGRTRFVHEEVFHGLAVPFLSSTMRKTEQGFRAMDAALKERVEHGRRLLPR